MSFRALPHSLFRQFAVIFPRKSLTWSSFINCYHLITFLLFWHFSLQWFSWNSPAHKSLQTNGFPHLHVENHWFLQIAGKWLGTCCNLRSRRLFNMVLPAWEVLWRSCSSWVNFHQCRNCWFSTGKTRQKISPRLHTLYVQAYMGRAFTTKGPSTVDYPPSHKLTN